MKIKTCFALGLTALLLLPTAASAQDSRNGKNSSESEYHTQMPRYEFEIEPGNAMLFREPVSFIGEVIATSSHDRTIRAANNMTIRVPNQALVWNGNRRVFNQTTEIGDEIVVHMRSEEPYRIMRMSSGDPTMIAVGSYDGVFYFSDEFIADLDLENLDNNIYADRRSKDQERYDVDLSSVKESKNI